MRDEERPVLWWLVSAPLSTAPARRYARLFLEAALAAVVAVVLARAAVVEQSGVVSIFLAAAGLTARFDSVLAENEEQLRQRTRATWRVYVVTGRSVAFLFAGMFVTYIGVAAVLGEEGTRGAFRFAVEAARLGADTMLTRRFPSAVELLGHNALVLASFATLTFLYRSYGALLALGWNACVWGLVLTFLVSRAVVFSTLPAPVFVLAAFAACLPHLILETGAYVFGGLASIALSRGLETESLRSPGFRRVVLRSLTLLALALLLISLSALVESRLPSWALARLR